MFDGCKGDCAEAKGWTAQQQKGHGASVLPQHAVQEKFNSHDVLYDIIPSHDTILRAISSKDRTPTL